MTPGLERLRDALAQLLAEMDGEPPWFGLSRAERQRWVHQAEELLEEPDSLGLLAAVDTLVSEGFQRGASPAVGALLAEVGHVVPDTKFGAGFQEGLSRAIQVLSSENAAAQQEAYERGFRAGRAASRDG